ncbi:unnamed protein product, partial [Symbiodinium microadriaticum]
MHVRHGLIDPGVPEDVFHVPTEQRPRRRLTEKLPPSTVEMRQLIQQDDDVGTLATERAQELLEQWSTDGAMDLIRVLASKGFFENRKFGVYRHGGTVGWLTGLVEYPSLTKLLTKEIWNLYTIMGSRSEGTSESEWTMFLDLDPGVVQVADARNDIDGIPQVSKIEVSYTHNIEDVLSQLSNPLDVTHTVRPEEVFKNMDAWKPAILKEVKGVEVAIERLTPGTEARRKWLGNPRVQKLPMKFVFTVKPNDKAVFADRSTWYKRKARLVICGNMATDE